MCQQRQHNCQHWARLICLHHTPGVHFLKSSVQVYTFWCTPSTPCVGHVLVIAPKNPIWLTNCETEFLQMFISKFCFLVHFYDKMPAFFFTPFSNSASMRWVDCCLNSSWRWSILFWQRFSRRRNRCTIESSLFLWMAWIRPNMEVIGSASKQQSRACPIRRLHDVKGPL